MRFPSPSGRAAVEIWQERFDNSMGSSVELVIPEKRVVLDSLDRETAFYFVHVYWSPDEMKVGILATGSNGVRVAANVKTGKPLAFGEIQKEFDQSLRKTYHVPEWEDDPVTWANNSHMFFRLHPEIKLTYR